MAANDCDLEPVAYEFFTQSYILYEEDISDSKAQVTAIHLILGTLQRTHIFGVENRDTLMHKATGISDGCQWRKFDQKMAKGSSYSRAYCRCTKALRRKMRTSLNVFNFIVADKRMLSCNILKS